MTARKKKKRDPLIDKVIEDLSRMAAYKAGNAIADAGQLLESPRECYMMALAVICSLITSSAAMLGPDHRLTPAKIDRTLRAIEKALKEGTSHIPPEGVKV